jgi:hypothetical protein
VPPALAVELHDELLAVQEVISAQHSGRPACLSQGLVERLQSAWFQRAVRST